METYLVGGLALVGLHPLHDLILVVLLLLESSVGLFVLGLLKLALRETVIPVVLVLLVSSLEARGKE